MAVEIEYKQIHKTIRRIGTIPTFLPTTLRPYDRNSNIVRSQMSQSVVNERTEMNKLTVMSWKGIVILCILYNSSHWHHRLAALIDTPSASFSQYPSVVLFSNS